MCGILGGGFDYFHLASIWKIMIYDYHLLNIKSR